MDDQSTILSQIIDVERAWAAAHLNLDLDQIEEILSEDYRQIQPDGSLLGKDELLASYKSGLRSWEIAESDEFEIRLLGNTALLIGRWRGKGDNNGHVFDYQARFLAVYQLEDGRWKLISDVSVPLAESN
jgi:ketosteroid isomerase-like protein